VWRPSASDEYRLGEEQLDQRPPSRLQAKDERVLDVKVKDADVDATVPLGPDVIVVFGSWARALAAAPAVAPRTASRTASSPSSRLPRALIVPPRLCFPTNVIQQNGAERKMVTAQAVNPAPCVSPKG
jgi:hypothetical protein